MLIRQGHSLCEDVKAVFIFAYQLSSAVFLSSIQLTSSPVSEAVIITSWPEHILLGVLIRWKVVK